MKNPDEYEAEVLPDLPEQVGDWDTTAAVMSGLRQADCELEILEAQKAANVKQVERYWDRRIARKKGWRSYLYVRFLAPLFDWAAGEMERTGEKTLHFPDGSISKRKTPGRLKVRDEVVTVWKRGYTEGMSPDCPPLLSWAAEHATEAMQVTESFLKSKLPSGHRTNEHGEICLSQYPDADLWVPTEFFEITPDTEKLTIDTGIAKVSELTEEMLAEAETAGQETEE